MMCYAGRHARARPVDSTLERNVLGKTIDFSARTADGDFARQLREVDGALLVSSVHQHELNAPAQNGDVAFRESARRFREMIDALPAAIYTTDAEGLLTHFNPACVEFSGRTPELGTDHWCVTWKLYYPDGRPMPHDECPMAIALKTGPDHPRRRSHRRAPRRHARLVHALPDAALR